MFIKYVRMNYVSNLNISNLHDNIQLNRGADDDSLELNGARYVVMKY